MATTPLAEKIKAWSFNGLVSVLGLMIWTDLQTIKTTLANATNQTTTDKANITNLENRVNKLEAVVYKQPRLVKSEQNIPSEPPKDSAPLFTRVIATKPDERELVVKIINKTTL